MFGERRKATDVAAPPPRGRMNNSFWGKKCEAEARVKKDLFDHLKIERPQRAL